MAVESRKRPAVGAMLDAAFALSELGFSVIPLGDPWTPPPPSVVAETQEERVRIWCKRPRVAWKEFQQTPPTEAQIHEWWGKWPYANVAIITGTYLVVDGDNLPAVQFLEANITSTPVKSVTARGKHLWYRQPKDLVLTNAASSLGIDIRGAGGYVVAPGSTYADGTVNTWEIAPGWDLADFNLLPELTTEDLGAIQRFGNEWFATNAAGERQGPERAQKPAGAPDDEDVLIDLGAVRTPHDGRPELPGGRNNALASQVGTWFQAGLSVQRVIAQALAWNRSCPQPLHEAEVVATVSSILATHIRKHGTQPHAREPETEKGFRVLSFAHLVDEPFEPPETYWQEGVLFRGARMLLAGPPKIGKSSLVIQLALAAATGGELLGTTFVKPLRVLWVQAEIHRAFLHQRVMRLATDFSREDLGLLRDNFALTGRCDLDLLDEYAYGALTRALVDHTPDLLILDPIINFSSADENDNAEMRKLLRLVDALAAKGNCAIILVHHTRKDAAAGTFDAIRGASALRGWFDTGLMLSGDSSSVVASFECRNAAALPAMLLEKTEQGRFIPCAITEDGELPERTMGQARSPNARPSDKANHHRKPTTPPTPRPAKPITKTDSHRLNAIEIVRRATAIPYNELTDRLMRTSGLSSRSTATSVIKALVHDGELLITRDGRNAIYTLADHLTD